MPLIYHLLQQVIIRIHSCKKKKVIEIHKIYLRIIRYIFETSQSHLHKITKVIRLRPRLLSILNAHAPHLYRVAMVTRASLSSVLRCYYSGFRDLLASSARIPQELTEAGLFLLKKKKQKNNNPQTYS